MKIAVWIREGRVLPISSESAEVFVAEIDPATHTVSRSTVLPSPDPTMELADWFRAQQVSVVLSNGMARRDQHRLESNGIQVVLGVPPFRVEPVIARYLAGTLGTGPVGLRESRATEFPRVRARASSA